MNAQDFAEPSMVDQAILTRRSVRRFLPTPVRASTVRELIELAACAPSGTNVQPWRVYAFAEYPANIREVLGVPDDERVLCGMALGYADPDAPENRLRTCRETVDSFTDFRGF